MVGAVFLLEDATVALPTMSSFRLWNGRRLSWRPFPEPTCCRETVSYNHLASRVHRRIRGSCYPKWHLASAFAAGAFSGAVLIPRLLS